MKIGGHRAELRGLSGSNVTEGTQCRADLEQDEARAEGRGEGGGGNLGPRSRTTILGMGV